MTQSSKTATTVGYLALLFWSTGALATTQICQLPILQVLSTTFIVSFIITSLWLTITNRWSIIRNQPWYIWFMGVSGVCLQQFSYIAAFKNGPALQVDILILLWPILVICLTGILTKERLKLHHVLSGLMGLVSIYLLNCSDHGLTLFSNWYTGYYYALICAVLWSAYTICSRYFSKTPLPLIGMYYGLGSLIVLPAHIISENFIMPTPFQWLILAYIGFITSTLAYFCWDYGVKKGNIKLLATLSYGNSTISLSLLIIFTNIQVQGKLGWACVTVCMAGFIAADGFSNCIKLFRAYGYRLREKFTQETDSIFLPEAAQMGWLPIGQELKNSNNNLKTIWKVKNTIRFSDVFNEIPWNNPNFSSLGSGHK